MDNDRLKKMDDSIQQWIRDNKRLVATPEMVISKLVEEQFYVDSENSLKLFLQEIKSMSKKEQREHFNIHRIGVNEIKFKNRENF
jgi:hypothetical protein